MLVGIRSAGTFRWEVKSTGALGLVEDGGGGQQETHVTLTHGVFHRRSDLRQVPPETTAGVRDAGDRKTQKPAIETSGRKTTYQPGFQIHSLEI